MDYSKITLGQLLSSEDITIKRNAMSILKIMQRCDHNFAGSYCIYCFAKKFPLCERCHKVADTVLNISPYGLWVCSPCQAGLEAQPDKCIEMSCPNDKLKGGYRCETHLLQNIPF